jgi:hypothetical protein
MAHMGRVDRLDHVDHMDHLDHVDHMEHVEHMERGLHGAWTSRNTWNMKWKRNCRNADNVSLTVRPPR